MKQTVEAMQNLPQTLRGYGLENGTNQDSILNFLLRSKIEIFDKNVYLNRLTKLYGHQQNRISEIRVERKVELADLKFLMIASTKIEMIKNSIKSQKREIKLASRFLSIMEAN